MLTLDYLGYFLVGFTGGFGHCIGMCHPFVLYVSGRFVGDKTGYSNLFVPHLKYNIGRTVTYALMGAAAGFFGGIVNIAGNLENIQKISAVIAGIFLIVYGLLSIVGYNILNKLENKVAAEGAMNFIKKFQPKGAFATGLILGLLPCGLLYSVLIGSTSSGSAFSGMIAMTMFGIGTMFALMTTSVFGNFIMKKRGIFNVLSLFLLVGMGIWFIYSGLTF